MANIAKPKPLTRIVKGIGYFLGPTTPTGKAFVLFEKGMTKIFERLGQSDRYLDAVGGILNNGLRARAMYVTYQENMLHAMRMPSMTEMDELREQVRDVQDQLEAVSSQIEIVIESLERQRRRKGSGESAQIGATKNENGAERHS